MRHASSGAAQALVVGVYPSAFHVAWTPPPALDPRPPGQTRPYIGSLAVDVEPVVFWDGLDPPPSSILDAWVDAVGFVGRRHGAVRPGVNGPSGSGLVDRILGPLGLGADTVAYTDAVPWFFVKPGRGGQAAAIEERFAPAAEQMGVPAGSLPKRPSARRLPALAVAEPRRSGLRAEILEASAPAVITLGQEALDAVVGVADSAEHVPRRLEPHGYGQLGTMWLDRLRFAVLPLAHPGFLRLARDASWLAALATWEAAPPRW